MSCAEALQTALKPLGLPVYPNKYTGPELEYIVTNYTTLGSAHGGDFAQAARYLVQVHYYLPDKKNPNDMLAQICRALAAADFSCPDIVPGHSDHGQHWAIECEYCDGGVDYGAC
jgi:hypothetical protein